MRSYEPPTPRVAIAMSAIVMTALTISLMVVAPATMGVDHQESVVAASKVITEASANAVSYSVSDYLAVHELALDAGTALCMCEPDTPQPVVVGLGPSVRKKTSPAISSSFSATAVHRR